MEFQKIKEKPQYRFRKELFLKIGIFFSLFALTIISVFFYITEKSSYTQDTILDAHEYYLYSNLVESWGFPPDTLKVKETLKNLKLFGCIYKNNEKIWANPQSFSKDGYVSFSDSDTLGILYDIDIPVYVSFGEIYKEKYDYTVTYANYGDYEYLMALEYYLPSEITTKFIPGSIMTIIAVALLFIVIRNYLQPIQLMKNRILLLQKGDLESTIPIIGEDELADLSNEINKMIQEIKELLNRKQLLLSEVSHELLSPLARIRLLAEMLPEHKNKIRLADEIQFLKGMVTNLLMSDRLSGPYANLELSTINTEELINKTIAMFPNSYDKILISGKTGSGKTSLVEIISGLNYNFHGDITLNKKKINKDKLENLRDFFSIVPQEIFIFETTILDNIVNKTSNNKVDLDKLRLAIKCAELEKFVNNKKNKLDYVLALDGQNMSGGQKQRIGIARALYKNTPVIIFDEATNALDEKTESKIYKNIKKYYNDKTFLCISHNNKVSNFFNKRVKI